MREGQLPNPGSCGKWPLKRPCMYCRRCVGRETSQSLLLVYNAGPDTARYLSELYFPAEICTCTKKSKSADPCKGYER